MKTRLMPRKRRTDLAAERPESFFVVDLVSAELKELVPHLEHPFFGLSKIPIKTPRRYEDGKGQYIELHSPTEFGLPTIFDQDFVIYCTSVIMAERQRLKENPHQKRERRVNENVLSFSVADFAEFTGRIPHRAAAGSWYDTIEAGLRRLTSTTLITNLAGGGVVRTDMFGMIDRASIVRRETLRRHRIESGLIGCQIKLSDWMMAAIDSNQILTLDRDYFRLRRPLDRRIYQIARKHCGKQDKWECSLPVLHAKSGALSPLKTFRRQFKDFIARWDERREDEDMEFLGYRPEYDSARDTAVFRLVEERALQAIEALVTLPKQPSEKHIEIIRAALPGYDPYSVYEEWREFALNENQRINNPDAALRGFARRFSENKPQLTHHFAAGQSFPDDESIAWCSIWGPITRENAPGWDVDEIAGRFRKFCKKEQIPLDDRKIAARYTGFCAKIGRHPEYRG